MLPRNKISHDPHVRDSAISSTGALVAYSGDKTGRTPKEKRVVSDDNTRDVSIFILNRASLREELIREFGGAT